MTRKMIPVDTEALKNAGRWGKEVRITFSNAKDAMAFFHVVARHMGYDPPRWLPPLPKPRLKRSKTADVG
jgi:hypothetical protein